MWRVVGPFAALFLVLVLFPHGAVPASVVVSNGYEFHASLTSPQVTWILVASNVRILKDSVGVVCGRA